MISLFFVSINDKTHIFYEIQYNTKSTQQKRENKKSEMNFVHLHTKKTRVSLSRYHVKVKFS